MRPRTQVEDFFERSAAAISRGAVVGTVRLAAGRACAGIVCRGASPWLLVVDGARFGVETVGLQSGWDDETTRSAGEIVGFIGSVAAGAALGGAAGLPGAA